MSEAEAMGAYEPEFDEYEEGLSDGYWIQRCGTPIHITKMAYSHIQNVICLCEKELLNSNFSCDEEKWNNWIQLLTEELQHRRSNNIVIKNQQHERKKKKASKTIKDILQNTALKKLQLECHCGTEYTAKTSDLKRGWALTCSKRCAAIRRELGSKMPKLKE
ncbi:TPA: hypothetical protein U2J54_001325 [Providencia rettgeri]|uniref:hypothetical protein n=1 Tax=Providencia rettgeri TaxID=587 RepID=UPI001B3786BD|nr:hypothetical protein [Providencia rettgeri]EMA4784714.1 hypothetical protein [Providencia rettgeri]MBQ0207851.1 hypothetical protein [Providencia rettgeri]MDR9614047.1 hypothetical protein [Providencia rettgeri]HEM7508341.1 hypothetical protein [Providencia rettgeri]HEM8269958.1 hypothetical protein [Providencia rettgeri]